MFLLVTIKTSNAKISKGQSAVEGQVTLIAILVHMICIIPICKGDANRGKETVFTCSYEEIIRGYKRTINDNIVLENSVFNVSYNDDTVRKLSFHYCPLPQGSYVGFLSRMGINASSMEVLTLFNMPIQSVRLNASHLEGLNIYLLNVFGGDAQHLSQPMDDFLDPLTKLRGLIFNRAVLPPLTSKSPIETIYLRYGTSTGAFGYCGNLETVYLEGWEISYGRWLASCPKLTTLSLVKMTDSSVFRAVRQSSHLQFLKIHDCNIFVFPKDFFDDMQDLKELDLSKNRLDHLNFLLDPFPSLQVLNLSQSFNYNDARKSVGNAFEHVSWLLTRLPELRSLDLSSNPNFNLCSQDVNDLNLTINHVQLKELDLSNTATTSLCIENGALPALRYLGLAGNFRQTPVIKFQELLVSKVPLLVDFFDFKYFVTDIIFTKNDYDVLLYTYLKNKIFKSGKKVPAQIKLVGVMTLDCDCKHALFARALRDNFVNAEMAQCMFSETYMKLAHVSPTILSCDKFICGDSSNSTLGCDCRRNWLDNATTADCRGKEVYEIPHVHNLSRVVAPHNRIQALSIQDLPDTLVFLDVTNNHISRLDEEQATRLFANSERRINISGNPIVCDCDNRAFINTIKLHHFQVEDYDNLTCAGGDIFMRDVDPSKLCLNFGIGVVTASSVAGALIAFAALVGTLYYRFRKMIRIYLYARGWCLCCIRKDDFDADRHYDAFVSFCYADESLVSEQLVPQLEERGFRICVHYRNWVPGELIPTQIVRSVETSRRTIVVLSRSFLQSMWGLLEFRIAHVRALKDGIARIILIVIDDVVDEDTLDEDLRSYIRTSTYVRWDDPWFWDKLKYAMPHGLQP